MGKGTGDLQTPLADDILPMKKKCSSDYVRLRLVQSSALCIAATLVFLSCVCYVFIFVVVKLTYRSTRTLDILQNTYVI